MEADLRLSPPRSTWLEARPPFLVIRLLPGTYSVQLMPTDLSRAALVELGWKTMEALGRRHSVCVVFGWFDAAFLEFDGSAKWSQDVPCGGALMDPPEELLHFLPVVVDPEAPVRTEMVYWKKTWKWEEILRIQTEALQAPWLLGQH